MISTTDRSFFDPGKLFKSLRNERTTDRKVKPGNERFLVIKVQIIYLQVLFLLLTLHLTELTERDTVMISVFTRVLDVSLQTGSLAGR